jgi:hypothetical protein
MLRRRHTFHDGTPGCGLRWRPHPRGAGCSFAGTSLLGSGHVAGAPVEVSAYASSSPSIVPSFDYETCIVLDDFGQVRVYRETNDEQADRETVITNIIGGQYEKPRVIAFNTAEGWSRDITLDIAGEIVDGAARKGGSKQAQAFVEWATGEDVPANLVD